MKLLRVHVPLQMKTTNRNIYIYSRGCMLVQWSYIICTCVHTSVTVRSVWWTVLCVAWVILHRGKCVF
jgi:hypothetical protein